MARLEAISARERRVIAAGTVILLVALVLTYGVVPFVRQWSAREAAIAEARDRITLAYDLIGRTTTYERAATDDERALAMQRQRVFHARSSTLAASALQAYLQEAADASHVVVTRLEVSPDDSSASDGAGVATRDSSIATTRLPATLSAYGDITGATALLNVLMTGPRVVSVERLSLSRNAALLGAPDVVQLTMSLRVPVLPP